MVHELVVTAAVATASCLPYSPFHVLPLTVLAVDHGKSTMADRLMEMTGKTPARARLLRLREDH
jgi:hypothetical protein